MHYQLKKKSELSEKKNLRILENMGIGHRPESVLENKTQKLLRDFDKQTDHVILARRLDQVIVNKRKERTCRIGDFIVSIDQRVKLKESEKRNEYCKRTKKIYGR